MPVNHTAEARTAKQQTLERSMNTHEIEVFKCSEDSYGYVFYVVQRS
jgi:hypothetical protein